MTKQEKILEWAENYLESVAHNGYYNGLGLRMLEDLSEQGCVLRVERELPIEVECESGVFEYLHADEAQRFPAVEPLIPTPATEG